MGFLDGKKSYIVGGVMILVGAAVLVTQNEIAGVTPADAFAYIMAGLGIISGKSALSKLEPPKE